MDRQLGLLLMEYEQEQEQEQPLRALLLHFPINCFLPLASGVGAVEVEVEVGCRYPDVPHSPTPLSPFTFHPSLRQTNLTIGFRSAASNFLSSSPVPDEPPSINLPRLPKTLRIADLQEHNQETPVLYSTPPHEPTNTERLTLPCCFAYAYAAAATPPAELAVATDIASQE